VDRPLREGDEVAGFTVLDVPGHSAGHVAFWRESDRVLVLGDVLNNMDVMTGRRGLHEPKVFFTPDPARNRESIHRLAALEPRLACFGHGPPLRDPRALQDFAAKLPA
jgi:glyoxylase-like metal-dependent hydrolase (beta-lactamase superfamily II)